MFANTLALIEEAGLAYLHVFPYSARAGTPAARMPQVAKPLRKERAARLRAAGERRARRLSRGAGRPAASGCWSRAAAAATPRLSRRSASVPRRRPPGRRGGRERVEAGAARAARAMTERQTLWPLRAAAPRATLGRRSRARSAAAGGLVPAAAAGSQPLLGRAQDNIAAIRTSAGSMPSLEELEEALISADLGVETAALLVEELARTPVRQGGHRRGGAERARPLDRAPSSSRSPSRWSSIRAGGPT